MPFKPASNSLKLQMFLVGSLLSAALLSSCNAPFETHKHQSPPEDVKPYSQNDLQRLVDQGNIVVVDAAKKPIADAQVLIGTELNQPFANNLIKTDSQGVVALPKNWSTETAVTVQATGYVRISYLAQKPHGLLFQLKSMQFDPLFELNGLTTGHVLKDKDDVLDFGLAMESLSKQDLLTFDLNKMISPLTETISVAGVKLQIPGNLTIPKQKESYIISLTIEKPQYRLSFSSPGVKQVYGLRGQFPFKKVVKEMQNKKPFYELINLFSFLSATAENIDVSAAKVTQDLNIAKQVFTKKVNFTAPAIANTQILVAISAAQQQGRWMPMDVKRFESAQAGSLSSAEGVQNLLVTILKNKNEFDPSASGMDRLSATIQGAQATPMLALIRDPEIISGREVKFYAPENRSRTTQALGTYVALNNLTETRNAKGDKEIKAQRQWELYAPTWVNGVTLPNFPSRLTTLATKNRRLEVMYMAGNPSLMNLNQQLDQELIENATQITRSSVDF